MVNQKIEIKTALPGPKSQAIIADLHEMESAGEIYFRNYNGMPPIVEESKGSYIKDVDGNTFLDFTAGFAALPLGHGPEKVVEAVVDQIRKTHHTAQMPVEIRHKLVKRLCDVMPGQLKNNCRVQFDLNGTNVVEIAVKTARAYTKRPLTICYSGGYHGRSITTLGLTGSAYLKRDYYPIGTGFERIPYPYCYRCPYGKEYGTCGMQCLKALDQMLSDPMYGWKDDGTNTNLVAGILFEPCQGAGGYLIPPKEYWPGVREICDKHNILMIDDEVQMGWGRSGDLFTLSSYGVVPDIMIMGKAFSAGVAPNAAVVGRKDIMDALLDSHQSVTFSGSPLGCAASYAFMDVMEEENILENVRELGAYALEKLKALKEKHPCIGDVQGLGLILAVEFVKDRETKEPAGALRNEVIKDMQRNGVLMTPSGHLGNRINIVAPLNATKEQMDVALDAMDKAITKAEAAL